LHIWDILWLITLKRLDISFKYIAERCKMWIDYLGKLGLGYVLEKGGGI
jgi:hypothetical protein